MFLLKYAKFMQLQIFLRVTRDQVEECNVLFDNALLIGCTQDLYDNCIDLKKELLEYFNTVLNEYVDLKLPILVPIKRQKYNCDIPQFELPSIEFFQKRCFEPLQPALLLNTFMHWPAVNKWRDLNYILKVAGNRSVPIEIGSNYSTTEWSQRFIKIRDFLQRQFQYEHDSQNKIEYLAQHELFDQIPCLMEDIRIPDYCILGELKSDIDINAWLGPKGTVSPLHYDRKQNLLCQVFGVKKIILAAPEDTINLYPHESTLLNNTSQIDVGNIDLEKFPKASKVKFYHLTLQEGDCLYIPLNWWHYVRSESNSFSVSFWWL